MYRSAGERGDRRYSNSSTSVPARHILMLATGDLRIGVRAAGGAGEGPIIAAPLVVVVSPAGGIKPSPRRTKPTVGTVPQPYLWARAQHVLVQRGADSGMHTHERTRCPSLLRLVLRAAPLAARQ